MAYHRFVFRLHEKDRLVRAANAMAIAGLGSVGAAVTAAIALVATFVVPGITAAVVVLATAGLFLTVWLLVPLRAAQHAPAARRNRRPPAACDRPPVG